jgi:lysophospholipase L1-like esterase
MSHHIENIVAFGDSIAHGLGTPDRVSWLKLLEQRYYEQNPTSLRAIFSDLSYVADDSAQLNRRINAELTSRLRPNRGHLSIVAIGTQDAWTSLREYGFIDSGSHPRAREVDDNMFAAAHKLTEYGDILAVGPTRCNTRMTSLYGRPDLNGKELDLKHALRLVNERVSDAFMMASLYDPNRTIWYVDLLEDSYQDPTYTLARDGVHPDEQGQNWIYHRVVPYFDRLVSMPALAEAGTPT